jgi:molybdate transport system ATP-binding protein
LHVEFRKRFSRSGRGTFDVAVSFVAGEGTTILFGPSGSGKTTTLRAIAGIVKPDDGRISVGEKVYFDSAAGINLSIQRRRVGYVFQDYALFPHLTAEENITYGMKDNEGTKSRQERVHEILGVFGIEHVRNRYPENMSGGEQQRTALARALASDPAVVLLDEPLSSVDAKTRSRLLDEIDLAQRRANIPFLYVTHNTIEAARLGSRVVVLEEGSVARVGHPSDVFLATNE